MKLILGMTLLALAVPTGPVSAQAAKKCPEGKTANGNCVRPLLAQSMRQRSLVFSQPKLSYTGFPTVGAAPPGTYDANRDHQQNLRYEQRAPTAASSGEFIPLPPGVNPATLHLGQPYTVVPGGVRTAR
jgi:hypothetical protein